MVMTKKEKELFDEALLRIELLTAFHWTKPVEPDVPIPQNGIVSGWAYNLSTRNVYEAWSSSNKHGDMPYSPKFWYGNGINLYSTKTKALAALRHAIEIQAASDLLSIDKRMVESHHE
jgi:hypothetical protein